jgi:hypothetical protein
VARSHPDWPSLFRSPFPPQLKEISTHIRQSNLQQHTHTQHILDCVPNVMAHAQKTRFRLSAKRTSPFKWAGVSVHSTTGSPGVRISGSNAGYAMFRGSVKSTGYPLHSPVSPSLPLPCVTVCHHVSSALYTPTIQLLDYANPFIWLSVLHDAPKINSLMIIKNLYT